MINKVFKTILILMISLGLSIPTNAAVSVSDGSAFVTKAEFAADLNNLSNRMAQLENSLDAKIDSLVSSYLTRNGIWNGAKQTLTSDCSAGFVGIQESSNAASRLIIYPGGGSTTLMYASSTAISSSDKVLETYSSGTTSGTLIETVSKTGLLYFSFRYALTVPTAWSTNLRVMPKIGSTNASETINGDWPNMYLGAMFSLTDGSGNTLWSMNVGQACSVPSSVFGYYVPRSTGVFFVDKGYKILWNLTNKSTLSYTVCYAYGSADIFGYKFQVLDVSVY